MLVAGTITMMELTMSISACPRINSDRFIAGAVEQPQTEHHELHDGVVRCGKKRDPDDIEISDPTITIEVLSPTERAYETGMGFAGHFRPASLENILV